MDLHLHQTHNSIGDFKGIFSYIEKNINKNSSPGLHVLPELFLTGYPLQDLCLQQPYIESYHNLLNQLDLWCQNQFVHSEEIALLAGGLKYSIDKNGLPRTIENVIYLMQPGCKLEAIYSKKLLPNYDIFDEKKYFTPGKDCTIFEFHKNKIALMLCEDMWPSSLHPIDPVRDIVELCQKKKMQIDLVVNLSASPFHLGKNQKRITRGMEISHQLSAPFCYVNRIGGEDEILFDGGSFVVSGNDIIKQASSFQSEIIHLGQPKYTSERLETALDTVIENTWESLFDPQLVRTTTPPTLPKLTNQDCETILEALKFGISEYANKNGFNKFLVALSGGIDSAIVLTITKLLVPKSENIEALFMPGFYSSTDSYELSDQLCKKLKTKLNHLPIKFLHSAIRNAYQDTFNTPLKGLADENIQSRIRGALLYARSNQSGSLVLNTSNKSELAVGYSTIYGDSVGAISLLGDLYKSEVYQLADYINIKYDQIIPEKIIQRPPTAELRENQEDSHSLPPYDRLDAMLEGILSYRMSLNDLINCGFTRQEVEKVYNLYQRSEYKRWQFCPIIKLKAKSFGFGYRIPICKKSPLT